MSDTLLLVVLIVLAFTGGHFITRFAARRGILSGAESLLVGIAIGPVGAGLLDGHSLDKAQLLMALLLGLVGFTTGMRARRLAPHPEAVVVGLATAAGVAAGMATLALAWMYYFSEPDGPYFVDVTLLTFGGWSLEFQATITQLEAAVVLGAAACASSSVVIESTARMHCARGPLQSLYIGAAVTGEIFAIILLGLALAARRNADSGGRLPLGITEWALLGMGVGVICGLLFAWFAHDEDEPKRIFVASTGTVIFAAGVGSAIGLSPTFVNLLAGLTVALVSPKAPAVAASLERLHHPIQVMVMIFAGMLLAVPSGPEWLLAACYPFARWGLLRVLMPTASATLLEKPIAAPRMGNGLLAQGALPVVIAVAFVMRAPEMASIVLTAVLVATVTSDLFSIRLLADVLLDAGEIEDTTGMRHGVPMRLLGQDEPDAASEAGSRIEGGALTAAGGANHQEVGP